MELTTDQLTSLQQWNEAKEELKRWRDKESELRDILVANLFNKDIVESTETIQLANGWTLKATKKLNYKLDNTQGEVAALCASLPDSLSRSLVRWKPELSLSTYRKLDPHTKQRLDAMLIIDPSKPSLDLIPPHD